jgi:hypothetical protein
MWGTVHRQLATTPRDQEVALAELAYVVRATGQAVSERVEAIRQGASMPANERDAHLYAANALTALWHEAQEDELRHTRALRTRGRKIAYEMVMKLEEELRGRPCRCSVAYFHLRQ